MMDDLICAQPVVFIFVFFPVGLPGEGFIPVRISRKREPFHFGRFTWIILWLLINIFTWSKRKEKSILFIHHKALYAFMVIRLITNFEDMYEDLFLMTCGISIPPDILILSTVIYNSVIYNGTWSSNVINNSIHYMLEYFFSPQIWMRYFQFNLYDFH